MKQEIKDKKLRAHITSILRLIGEDPMREGLIDTPTRIVKMYKEIFRGYDPNQKPLITTFPNGVDGVIYDQIITDQGYFFSTCEHHGISFFGEYAFGYIPDEKVLGLSKVARVIDYYSAKLQIQERLGKEIIDNIERVVKPKGLILQLKARHLCKEMRGVKKYKGVMTTSIVRGIFDKDISARQEFFELIKNK